MKKQTPSSLSNCEAESVKWELSASYSSLIATFAPPRIATFEAGPADGFATLPLGIHSPTGVARPILPLTGAAP